jgi:hypothetical protein
MHDPCLLLGYAPTFYRDSRSYGAKSLRYFNFLKLFSSYCCDLVRKFIVRSFDNASPVHLEAVFQFSLKLCHVLRLSIVYIFNGLDDDESCHAFQQT